MSTLRIEASRAYNVYIGRGIIDRVGTEAAKLIEPCRAVIVSGDNVFPLYGEALKNSLESAGFKVLSFVHESGENAKSLETYGRLLNFLCENHLSRSDAVFALGGGVTGDLAGFAAATYQRGMALVHIPTSLLAMVDSCVGGKCALNLQGGKNQVGAFYQPAAVFCDTDTLKTLPEENCSEGWAEIIKYGILDASVDFTASDCDIDRLIYDCLRVKKSYVEKDELDCGDRRYLNLGHTLAHALEKYSGYTVSHGRAVAMGLAVMTGYNDKVCLALKKHGLPRECPYPRGELCKLMISDKKRHCNSITLVVPKSIGNCELVEVPTEKLESFIFGGCHE